MKKLPLLFAVAFMLQFVALSQSCLPEGITFTTQEQIDNFQTNYPGCTVIEGGVEINGDSITNLRGLNVLTSIQGKLAVWSSDSLKNLLGLDNLTSVGESLFIGNYLQGANHSLESLTGLESLTNVGGVFLIFYNPVLPSLNGLENLKYVGRDFYIWDNVSLTSITALENLESVGGEVWIRWNSYLQSISALRNIDPNTISDLIIEWNYSLSICEAKSICDYLVNPNGIVDIHDNATGCKNVEEIEDACESAGIEDQYTEPPISIYPNPAKNELFVSTKSGIIIKEIRIYNQTGQTVLNKKEFARTIDISMLKPGLYIIEVSSDELMIREKLVVR